MEPKFRVAINGFNREDVINFIDKCMKKHDQEIQSLQDERSALLSELDQLRTDLASAHQTPPAPSTELEAENEALRKELKQLYAEKQSPDPTGELKKLQEENNSLRVQLEQTQSTAGTAEQESNDLISKLRAENKGLYSELALVYNYLENANKEREQYKSQVKELQKEQEKAQEDSVKQSELYGQVFRLGSQNDRLFADLNKAKTDLDTANTTIRDLRLELQHTRSSFEEAQQLLSTPPQPTPDTSLSSLDANELAAYRRAESVERTAKLRAEEIERCAKKRAAEIERGVQRLYEDAIRRISVIMDTAALQTTRLAELVNS